MLSKQQAYARDLSRRHREDRLLGRAVYRAARKAKTPPPKWPEDKTVPVFEEGVRRVIFAGGSAFPKEWL